MTAVIIIIMALIIAVGGYILYHLYEEYDILKISYRSREKEIDELRRQITETAQTIAVDTTAAATTRLESLERLVKEKNDELMSISDRAASISSSINEKTRQLQALEARLHDSESLRATVEDELQNYLRLKSSVLAVEEGAGTRWKFDVSGKNSRLVDCIHQIVNEYGNSNAELRKVLLKAEWSIVWLPQVQQLCSREGLDRGGIYKISLKENPDVVYIGQAVSIKERWYTHIKKMLGVEAKGSERLYEYRPDEVTWEVIEFKDGNLNADEKYWIDYFKCKEIGLNKKR